MRGFRFWNNLLPLEKYWFCAVMNVARYRRNFVSCFEFSSASFSPNSVLAAATMSLESSSSRSYWLRVSVSCFLRMLVRTRVSTVSYSLLAFSLFFFNSYACIQIKLIVFNYYCDVRVNSKWVALYVERVEESGGNEKGDKDTASSAKS